MVEVRPSSIHGLGGFATVEITAGARILPYRGERISKQESLRRCAANNSFIFYLDEQFDLDGSVEANPARWLNHSCSPNSEARRVDGEIWIVAAGDIHVGEEITFNYGYDLESYREYPCHCGAENCLGYILAEEFHPLVRRGESRARSGLPNPSSQR